MLPSPRGRGGVACPKTKEKEWPSPEEGEEASASSLQQQLEESFPGCHTCAELGHAPCHLPFQPPQSPICGGRHCVANCCVHQEGEEKGRVGEAPLLSPAQEGEAPHQSLATEGKPHQSSAAEGKPPQSPVTKGEPHQTLATEGEPHQFPVTEREPYQSPVMEGDYPLLSLAYI
ncbi:UNVERIFIED_CONTAM: hypothetical protein FKN15_005297 [Acipenser sinensis]